MKNNNLKSHSLLLAFIFIGSMLFAQTNDAEQATNSGKQEQEAAPKKDNKKRSDFKVFGGINFNKLSMDERLLKPEVAVGWSLGASYKRGRFLYWGIGATYNHSVYNLLDTTFLPGALLDGVFNTNNIDIPVTVGVNFLFFASRLVGLRVYVSAVPSFIISVGDNKLNISSENTNAFNFYGQGGVGVDVAFIFVEVGYNYGFVDLFTNDIRSNPNQIFVNLGFRF